MLNKPIQRFNSLKFFRILKRNKTISQINVTPMVDVMLVLLVIFMITAPLLTVGVPINLPKTTAKALPEDQTPLAITINNEEKIFLQETEIDLENLIPRLLAISENKRDTKIFIRADKILSYGKVVDIMLMINSAVFNKIALVILIFATITYFLSNRLTESQYSAQDMLIEYQNFVLYDVNPNDGSEVENDVISLGFAGRLKLTQRLAIVADYFHNFSPYYNGNPSFSGPLGIGIEVETGGHVFHINFCLLYTSDAADE